MEGRKTIDEQGNIGFMPEEEAKEIMGIVEEKAKVNISDGAILEVWKSNGRKNN